MKTRVIFHFISIMLVNSSMFFTGCVSSHTQQISTIKHVNSSKQEGQSDSTLSKDTIKLVLSKNEVENLKAVQLYIPVGTNVSDAIVAMQKAGFSYSEMILGDNSKSIWFLVEKKDSPAFHWCVVAIADDMYKIKEIIIPPLGWPL